LLPVIIIAFILWLGGLSFSVYWIWAHYKKLGSGVKAGNLIKVLDELILGEKKNESALKDVLKSIENIELKSQRHIQKFGLVRYNPFNEIGGDQSFSFCLLDGQDNGFVITCLHTRDRTRVYSKGVIKGKSKYELSKDEKKAIETALKKK